MAFKMPSLVHEETTTTGTGTVTLDGAVSPGQAFSSQLSDGDTTIYAIFDSVDYEVGEGTWNTSGGTDTLSRDTVLLSSNGGSKVNWGVGTRNVTAGIATDQVQSLLDPAQSNGLVERTSKNTYAVQTHAEAATASTIAKRDSNGNLTVADATTGSHAVTKDQHDNKYDKSGGTISGDVTVERADGTNIRDVENASFVQALDINGEDNSPVALALKSDGTSIYAVGDTNQKVFQYNLSTAYDISSVSSPQLSAEFDISTEIADPRGLAFKADGSKMYVSCHTNDIIQQYSLGTPWDVSTASTEASFDPTGEDNIPRGITFKGDGAKMYMAGQQNGKIYEYDLGTPWDVSTATLNDSLTVSGDDNSIFGLFVRSNGVEIFLVGQENDKVYQYEMSTAWDITTATLISSFDVSSKEATPHGVTLKDDLSKLYVTGTGSTDINEYDIHVQEGPTDVVDANNDSAIDDDFLGQRTWDARSDLGNTVRVLSLVGKLLDATDSQEDARLLIRAIINGTLTDVVSVGPGMQVGSPTGGDQGSGTVNATEYYRNGTKLLTEYFESSEQSISNGSKTTVSHGLSGVPKTLQAVLVCKTTELNYSVGMEVAMNNYYEDGGSDRGLSIASDSSEVNLTVGNNGISIMNLNSGALSGITNSRWRIVVRAWF